MTEQATELAPAATRYLVALLAVVRRRLERCAASDVRAADIDEQLRMALRTVSEVAGALDAPTPIDAVSDVLGLSRFERDILLLCAGVELDRGIAAACARVQGAEAPTFGLALLALPEAAWGALAPDAPLRRWQLVELGPGDSLVTRPMRLDDWALHYLLGIQCMDERLAAVVTPERDPDWLAPSHAEGAERLARLAASGQRVVAVHGVAAPEARAIAARACADLGMSPWVAHADDLPEQAAEQVALARLWERQAALTGCALIVQSAGSHSHERAAAFATRVSGLVVMCADEPVRLRDGAALQLAIAKPAEDEQRGLWRRALGPRADALADEIEQVVAQFDLGAHDIAAVSAALRAADVTAAVGADRSTSVGSDGSGDDAPARAGALWAACQAQVRPGLDGLGQRIEPRAGWDDLIVSERQGAQLREIAGQVRQRSRVYEHWGFSGPTARGLGITALFAGPSGTGKTTAAEVLAAELQLDLYRIDLSAVVSKYIGETEKNLRRVFDAAEGGSAILLFDEADALFGKRSEVRDSRDRYANMEVSYLLQRMESYRGLAILTTNLRDAMDSAFTRRIRFTVEFPFPTHADRAAIWARAFPPGAPTQGVDPGELARLNLSGGSIRNVALTAAFLAADGDEPIQMRHLRAAARSELAKLERPVNEHVMKDWQ